MAKKKVNKARRMIPIFIGIFIILMASCVAFLIYMFSGNYITQAYEDLDYSKVTEAMAKDSNIIVYNGIVLGASKNNTWISAEKYYEANPGIKDVEVNLYSKDNLYGTFKTASLVKHRNGVVFTTIGKDTTPEQYLALSSKISKSLSFAKKVEATDMDVKYVKEALSSYKFLNGGVNITEVYATNIESTNDKIICATAKKANIMGVYSVVVYVTEEKAYIVKYAYAKDTKNADNWPVYSVKHIKDLDGDNTPEIILEEVNGYMVKYNVLELRENHKFYQVLRVSVEI